jgi:hypothetical protein
VGTLLRNPLSWPLGLLLGVCPLSFRCHIQNPSLSSPFLHPPHPVDSSSCRLPRYLCLRSEPPLHALTLCSYAPPGDPPHLAQVPSPSVAPSVIPSITPSIKYNVSDTREGHSTSSSAAAAISSEFLFVDHPASAIVDISTASDDEVSLLGEDDSFIVMDASQN